MQKVSHSQVMHQHLIKAFKEGVALKVFVNGCEVDCLASLTFQSLLVHL